MSENDEKKLKRSFIELQSLYDLETAISATLNLNQLLNLIMNMTTDILKCEVGIILLRDEVTQKYIPRVTWGLNYEVIKYISYKDGTPFLKHINSLNNPLVVDDLDTDENFIIGDENSHTINATIAAPIKTKNNNIGVIILANKTENAPVKVFDNSDKKLFESICSHISSAIENAQLYEEILEMKNYNESIINSISSGVITTDLNGIIKTINNSAEFILGITAENVFGQNVDVLFKTSKDKRFKLNEFIKSGENILNYELTLERNTKETIIVAVSISILNDIGNNIIGAVIVIDDFTEKKLLEHQIRRSDQLAALGELSAGLAHEIKNPLTSIRGFTQLLPLKIDNPEFREKYINLMTKEVDRLNGIVERLLSFARPQATGRELCDLNEVVKSTLSLMNYQINKSNVHVTSRLMDMPLVMGDSRSLEQVFINLILNAIQAMPDGGKLMIRSNMIIRKTIENIYVEYAMITLEDSGIGIPDENIRKLFNPFFTTKDTGTGLGLSITHRIIQEHNGLLEVESKIGKGTKFAISIPTVKKSEELKV